MKLNKIFFILSIVLLKLNIYNIQAFQQKSKEKKILRAKEIDSASQQKYSSLYKI